MASGGRTANCLQIGSVFLAISVMCSRRLPNYVYDMITVTATATVTVLWAVIFALNVGIVIAGFARCNVPRLQKHSPLDSGSYCHFFGNPDLAEKSGWDGKAWPAYYWASLALFLMVAFWQVCVTFSPVEAINKQKLTLFLKAQLVHLAPPSPAHCPQRKAASGSTGANR